MKQFAYINKAIAVQEARLQEAQRKFKEEGFGLALVNYDRGKLAGMRHVLDMVERNA